MKRLLSLIAGLLVIAFCITGCVTSHAGPETTPYKLVRTDGDFEIREYPGLKTAASSCGSGKVDNSNLIWLSRCIDGGKMAKEKLAFVVPEKKQAVPPAPASAQASLKTKKPWRVAVYRFRGPHTDKLKQQALAKLKNWMQQNKLLEAETPFSPRFDYPPPWTPGFLSRNEVSAPISPI